MVFRKKTEHPRHRVLSPTQADPERGDFRNRAANQLSEGVLEGLHSRGQGTPRSLEATRLHDSGRRVQTLRLDPRPTVEVGLEPRSTHGPVGESMWWKNRERQTATMAEVSLDPFQARAFRIGVAEVVIMAMDGPRTTAGTHRTRSSELILAQLDGQQKPESSRQIESFSFGLHDATPPPLLANVPLPRSHFSSKLYTIARRLVAQ